MKNKPIIADHFFEKFNKKDTWCKHCNCEKHGEEIEHKKEIEIYQKSDKDHKDSFWYRGDIALLTEGNRQVVVVANGDIRIHNKEGEMVHDNSKARNNMFPEFKDFTPQDDKDLAKLEKLGYRWENNNWFECFYIVKGDSVMGDIMGDVRFDYDRAIQMGKEVLTSKDYKHLWD